LLPVLKFFFQCPLFFFGATLPSRPELPHSRGF
jgi:hypothetical protein